MPRSPVVQLAPDRYQESPTCQLRQLMGASALADDISTNFSIREMNIDESSYAYAWGRYKDIPVFEGAQTPNLPALEAHCPL